MWNVAKAAWRTRLARSLQLQASASSVGDCGQRRFYSVKSSIESSYDSQDERECVAANANNLKRKLPNKRRQVLTDKAAQQRARNQQEPLPKMKWNFDMRVVDVNRTFKVTKSGGIQSFTAFVVCGNYEGIAGYGKGKAGDVSYAVDKAYRRSLKNLHFFDIYRNRTIYHSILSKYGSTKVALWPAKKNAGIVASDVVGDILYMAGYKDMKTKVIGSRHPHNTVKALFKALCTIETPDIHPSRAGPPPEVRPQAV